MYIILDKSSMLLKAYIFHIFFFFSILLPNSYPKPGVYFCLFVHLSIQSSTGVCIAPPLHCLSASAPRAGKQSGECFSAFAISVPARKKNNHPTSLLVKTVEPRDKSGKRVSRRRQQEEWHPQGPVARPDR